MSEDKVPDLGKIISLIMENPKLIEEISSLAKGENEKKATPVLKESPPVEVKEEAPASAAPIQTRRGRGELLSLLKPYLSEKRASAIESMLSVTDVLKMMKRGN